MAAQTAIRGKRNASPELAECFECSECTQLHEGSDNQMMPQSSFSSEKA